MSPQTISLEEFATDIPDVPGHGGCAGCGVGRGQPIAAQSGNGPEKTYPTTAVRFGHMRYIGEFSYSANLKFTCGAKVIIQTKRGIEIGEQVSLSCSGCEKAVPREQTKAWVDRCGSDAFIFDAGRLLREATAADLSEYARIAARGHEMRSLSQGIADRLGLALRVAECEYLFGGERIIFFFTAPERVDYRVMVKELAKEYRTRIEMRQIGARDEARLLTDYETCGREVCCKVFLKTLRPVSMRMAKLQKATLDPSQVSGRCGRLKCCLRYEHTGYEELDKRIPRVGVRIRTMQGDGVVTSRQVLTQLVQVRTAADEMLTVAVEDIIPPGTERPPEAAPAEPVLPANQRGSAPSSRGDSPPSAAGPRRSTRRRSGRARKAGKPQTDSTTPDGGKDTTRQPTESGTAAGSTDEGATKETPKRSTRRRRQRSRRRRRPSGDKPGGESPPPEG